MISEQVRQAFKVIDWGKFGIYGSLIRVRPAGYVGIPFTSLCPLQVLTQRNQGYCTKAVRDYGLSGQDIGRIIVAADSYAEPEMRKAMRDRISRAKRKMRDTR